MGEDGLMDAEVKINGAARDASNLAQYGKVNCQIGAIDGHVVVSFPHDVRFLRMKPDEACALADYLVRCANQLGAPVLLVPERVR